MKVKRLLVITLDYNVSIGLENLKLTGQVGFSVGLTPHDVSDYDSRIMSLGIQYSNNFFN